VEGAGVAPGQPASEGVPKHAAVKLLYLVVASSSFWNQI
jgi:hypothetical protein